jgi:hypothetical protein
MRGGRRAFGRIQAVDIDGQLRSHLPYNRFKAGDPVAQRRLLSRSAALSIIHLAGQHVEFLTHGLHLGPHFGLTGEHLFNLANL